MGRPLLFHTQGSRPSILASLLGAPFHSARLLAVGHSRPLVQPLNYQCLSYLIQVLSTTHSKGTS